jgi:di/tricarboxylate transporter
VNAAQGNQVGLVAGTYFVVTLFNAAVTNNAAVSIFFPIAWEVAVQSKMDFYPLLLTLMFAGVSYFTVLAFRSSLITSSDRILTGSADFCTPYG